MSIYRRGTPAEGACPHCRTPLFAVENRSDVRWCSGCGGVFADAAASRKIMTSLDRGLLEVALKAGARRARPDESGITFACPVCLADMRKIRVESAACTVDACADHGTWFDAGELGDVMRAFTAARRRGIHAARPVVPRTPEPKPEEPVISDPFIDPLTELVRYVSDLLRFE